MFHRSSCRRPIALGSAAVVSPYCCRLYLVGSNVWRPLDEKLYLTVMKYPHLHRVSVFDNFYLLLVDHRH